MKSKILIVSNYIEDNGGISRVVLTHLEKLTEEGFTVEIFNTKIAQLFRLFLIIVLLIKARKYNILHLHGCSGYGFFPIVLGILCGKVFYKKKVIVTYHGGSVDKFLRKHSRLIKWFLLKADEITVMSKYLNNIFKEYGIRTTILNNVADLEIGVGDPIFLSYPRIISTRSLQKIYNIQDTIKAYRIIKNDFDLACLTIAGDGPQVHYLKNISKNLSGIEFVGAIPNKKVQELLRNHNIFISVPSTDNQPISILEAWASGCIVISSNVGGIQDMIRNEITGLLVDVNRPNQIAAKINWIFDNPSKALTIVNNGKKEVEKYLWPNVRIQLLKVYSN